MVLAIWQVPSRKDSRGLSLLDGIYFGEWVILGRSCRRTHFFPIYASKASPKEA